MSRPRRRRRTRPRRRRRRTTRGQRTPSDCRTTYVLRRNAYDSVLDTGEIRKLAGRDLREPIRGRGGFEDARDEVGGVGREIRGERGGDRGGYCVDGGGEGRAVEDGGFVVEEVGGCFRDLRRGFSQYVRGWGLSALLEGVTYLSCINRGRERRYIISANG